MTTPRPSLFARNDTFFGACEAIGQDFGFNPVYLRVAFAVAFLASPAAVLGTYLACAALVLLSRFLYPSRPAAALAAAATPAALTAGNDDAALALAA